MGSRDSVRHIVHRLWVRCSRSFSISGRGNVRNGSRTHGVARKGTWRGNWRMKWVASTLHTTSEHDVSSVTTADAHTSATSSRLNWRPRRFKWTRPFRRKTKSGFCACAITFQTQSTRGSFPGREATGAGIWPLISIYLVLRLTFRRLTSTIVDVPHR